MKKSTAFKQLDARLDELLVEREALRKEIDRSANALADFNNRAVQPLEERKQLVLSIAVKKELISHFEQVVTSVDSEYNQLVSIAAASRSLMKNEAKVRLSTG